MTDFLRVFPEAATSPLAFVAYILTLLVWAIITIETRRISTIMRDIEKFSEDDRRSVLETEIGMKLPEEVSPIDWLRARRQTYFFWGTVVLLAATLAIIAIAASVSVIETIPNDDSVTETTSRYPVYVKSETLPVELYVDNHYWKTLTRRVPASTIDLNEGNHSVHARWGKFKYKQQFSLIPNQGSYTVIIPPVSEWRR
ncbi:MAG: hypothetical protein MN733_13850 [Nitrososphaera sp.]|nr:hypothetical protein [Nitrososphaera sp.]